ncbi:MAG: ATP-binding cassette domain-containing protein [Steroidobacteraceae bacterium]
MALQNQSVGYAERLLLQRVTLTFSPGDRVALLGRNGAGKSTLMKLLAGELVAGSGTRTEARDLAFGYFAQHQLEQLAIDDCALGNLRRLGGALATRATEQELRDFLADLVLQVIASLRPWRHSPAVRRRG